MNMDSSYAKYASRIISSFFCNMSRHGI